MADYGDLLSEFATFGINVSNSVLPKCSELMTKYRMNAEEFVDSWVAFSIKMPNNTPNLDKLSQFESEVLARESSKLIKSEELNDSLVIHNITTINQLAEEDDLLGTYGTPARKSISAKRTSTSEGTPKNKRLAGINGSSIGVFSPSTLTSPTTPSTSKFSTRTNSGEVVAKYPPNETATIQWQRTTSLNATVRVEPAGGDGAPLLKSDSKYMFGRLRDKHAILEKHIDEIGDRLAEQLKGVEWMANHVCQSAPFRTVGRICCDATSGASARLNASSLLLQGTNETSSSVTVPLDVAQVREYSLFPGQVVAVEGTNPTGARLVANTITQPAIESIHKVDIRLDEHTGPMNIVVACGPFALVDELDYSPLQALLERVNAMEPHVAILLGPFLDVRNKKVETGDMQATYDEEFERIMNGLQATVSESVQVVVVPSWRDVHHQAVYPTAPFQRPKTCPPRFHFASDPCLLDICGVSVAVTSTDILLHLGKEEIAVAPQGSDRMGRLASHILGQQSFYPLYPPAEEMSIDLHRWADHCYLSSTPHVLILPSDLRHFVKQVEGCFVVNPERTVKGSSGGTYARLQLSCHDATLKVRGEIVRV